MGATAVIVSGPDELAGRLGRGPRPLAGGRPVRPPSVQPWPALGRVLALRTDSAGDVLMTGPALRALRAWQPRAHLALLTSPSGATAAQLLPELDEIVVANVPWQPGAAADPAADSLLLKRLRAGRFDAAVIFTVHTQSALPAALLCRMAGIDRRLAHVRENPYGLLTDWVPDPEVSEPLRHEVRRQLDLLTAAGIPVGDEHLSLHVPDWAMRRAIERLAQAGLDASEGWFVVHPGASAPSRRYGAAGFGRAARAIADRTGARPVITGSDDERTLAESVAALAGDAVNLAGDLSLPVFAALLAVAPLLVTGNTGPVHLAAAVGTPVVDVYAATNLQHTPWRIPARVLSADVPCAGCCRSTCPLGTNACLAAIPPDDVVAAALELADAEGIALRPSGSVPSRALAG